MYPGFQSQATNKDVYLGEFELAPTNHPDLPPPIRPSAKPRKGRKRKNVFIDDRGFPDQSHEFDELVHNIDGGVVLRKPRHPPRSLKDIDPNAKSSGCLIFIFSFKITEPNL